MYPGDGTPKQIEQGGGWFVVDAAGQVLGRVATRVARILIGKDKANYTPYLDCGDHVVVINADKIRLTGNKLEQKDLPPSQRLSRRVEGSAGQAAAADARGLDAARSGARHAPEEQVAGAAREEVADLSGRQRFGTPRGAKTTSGCSLTFHRIPFACGADQGAGPVAFGRAVNRSHQDFGFEFGFEEES